MRRSSTIVVLAAILGCDNEEGVRAIPNEPPIAVASVGAPNGGPVRLGYVQVGHSAILDGSLSQDTDDRADPVTFQWQFDELPADSALTSDQITVAADDPDTEVNEGAQAMFEPDVIGTYRISLQVTDHEDLVSEERDVVIVEAVPPSNLGLTLSWEENAADLDLHLISPDGTYFDIGSESDCFSWLPNPDWGDPAASDDNPMLADDADGEGGGPFREQITLARPQAGIYRVVVHYYSDHAAAQGNGQVIANPTLTITSTDVPLEAAASLTPPSPLSFGGENELWVVGEIHWPDQVFASVNSMSTHAAQGGPPYND